MEDGSVDTQEGQTGARARREVRPHAGEVALVGVRADVIGEAEHAFGNLFHRLHYLAQKLQNRGVEGAATLATSVSELEDLLRLVLDYASPLAVEARLISAEVVLGGLEAGLERTVGERAAELAEARLLADSGHLIQAFAQMRRVLSDGAGLAARVEQDDGSRWLAVTGFEPGRIGVASGRAMVPWALAQKLVEAQGGTLTDESADGGARWTLRLPLAGD